MLGSTPTQADDFLSPLATKIWLTSSRTAQWSKIAASTILILGSPRSGTTWLAKIFDSHPDILYRHEPDELVRGRVDLEPAEQVREWLRQRGLRTAAKRPHFRKSWRPVPLNVARLVLVSVLAALQRLPGTSRSVKAIEVPDLIAFGRWRSVRAAIKLVNWDGTAVVRSLPDTRCVFIIRHPCGQIASFMVGRAGRRFADHANKLDESEQMAAAADLAAKRGIDNDSFRDLPLAAKYAWGWLAFNEAVVEGMNGLPNARIVVYEELCRHPEAVSRNLFAFTGLDWPEHTAAFLDASTHHEQQAGYYDVFRTTNLVADRWRQTMSLEDQNAVRGVVATSPLARYWSDLAPAAPAIP